MPLRHHLLLLGVLALGLPADFRAGLPLQLAISAVFWGALIHVLLQVRPEVRRGAIACLVVATAGEVLLSLVLGLYRYRLGNIPLFVPPGHVMLYLVGLDLARRMPARLAAGILAGAGLYAAGAAIAGFDTFAAPLFLFFAVPWILLPAERRLLATTYLLALSLELFGTSLGTWTWERRVPGTALVTTNPPGLAGTLYCFRDSLVPVAVALIAWIESWKAAPVELGLDE